VSRLVHAVAKGWAHYLLLLMLLLLLLVRVHGLRVHCLGATSGRSTRRVADHVRRRVALLLLLLVLCFVRLWWVVLRLNRLRDRVAGHTWRRRRWPVVLHVTTCTWLLLTGI
jgi:hypothetical protein